jgi:uncharacterized membrane protein YhdT
MNEAVALATILLNGLEKTVSYRLQAKAPQIMRESNPIARLVIRRLGLFPTHLFFFLLSIVIVFLTYVLTESSPIAGFGLWLELACTAFVFLNNWILERHYCKKIAASMSRMH